MSQIPMTTVITSLVDYIFMKKRISCLDSIVTGSISFIRSCHSFMSNLVVHSFISNLVENLGLAFILSLSPCIFNEKSVFVPNMHHRQLNAGSLADKITPPHSELSQ